MLRAELFGIGKVRFFDRELYGFPEQQYGLLFGYLLLNRRSPHHREPLAAVFWGDYPTDVARKYLRNSLWRLRQTLLSCGAPPDDYLAVSEEYVTFNCTSRFWIDVEEFEQVITHYQDLPGAALNEDQAGEISRAVGLYVGDLLENIYKDWCLYERERMRLLYLDSLNKLMVYHATHGSFQRGIEFGERILASDNTCEKVHRYLMWLHWLAGDRNAALIQYRRCTEILSDELKVQPMEETRRLYEQIRAGIPPTNPALEPLLRRAAKARADDPALKPLIQQALQRMTQLHQILEQTNTELNQLQQLLDESLSEP